MTTDDTEYRTHTQTSSGKLGGEEGVKYLIDRLFIHAAAGVRNLDKNKMPGRCVFSTQTMCKVIFTCFHHAGAYGDDTAAVFDRFVGIGDQVHEHLLYLGFVSLDHRQVVHQ